MSTDGAQPASVNISDLEPEEVRWVRLLAKGESVDGNDATQIHEAEIPVEMADRLVSLGFADRDDSDVKISNDGLRLLRLR